MDTHENALSDVQIIPRRRSHIIVRITQTTGNSTPKARNTTRLVRRSTIQEKFIPKNPVRKLIGKKISIQPPIGRSARLAAEPMRSGVHPRPRMPTLAVPTTCASRPPRDPHNRPILRCRFPVCPKSPLHRRSRSAPRRHTLRTLCKRASANPADVLAPRS